MKRTVALSGLLLGLAAGLAPAETPDPQIHHDKVVMERVPNDTPHPTLSPEERQAMRERKSAMVAAANADANSKALGPPGRALVKDPQTDAVDLSALFGDAGSQFKRSAGAASKAEDDFVLGKSVINPNLPGAGASVVEPSISNQSLNVFYLSNNRADFSADGGTTFNQLAIPGGPADAPNFCCDQTIVYDPSHSMWIWSRLYTNVGSSNGVVHISVIKNAPTVECTYKYDPGGAADNMLPDYPQNGLSDNNFYQSTSEFENGVWTRSRMRRISLEELSTCPPSLTADIVTWNGDAKRVWTPVRGATDVMYWGAFENSTELRIWSWPESSPTASSTIRAVQATNFVDSDCRGGTNNLDWIAAKGWGIGEGFMRGAVARGPRLQFFWNGGADVLRPQAFIRSAVFELPAITLLAEPNINNDAFCYGYADVHPNARGDLGLSLARGGRNGGGGVALAGAVAIEDEFTSGFSVGTVFLTTTGTHMPTGQRYGDYLSVKPHEPCTLWWGAANYAFSGGGAAANVVGRYLQFGRERDKRCWDRWKAIAPPALP